MALDTNTDRGREVVSYVRVGRGMVKVTKYENEQPKSPSETASVRSGSSSGRSASTSGTATRGHGWLRRPRAKRSSKRTPSSHRHRSRSRSSVRSLHTIRRPSGYMRPEHDVSSSSNEHCSRNAPVLPDRRGRFESQGLVSTCRRFLRCTHSYQCTVLGTQFALDSLPVPGSLQPEEPSYDKDSNYPKSTPPLLIERGHRRGIHISPPLGTSPGQATSPPSPSPLSWATGYEIDSTADAEMWSHITRLEDELVSRFGRGAVPQLSSLRNEKSSAPPTVGTRGKRDLSPALPDELVAALQRDPPSTLRPGEKLKQRSFEPINLAEPPRRVHRAKSSPTLAFPLPPPTIPDWVNSMPLPAPPAELAQGITPSPTMMRAKAGPLPPFAPPPNFPPPPPPNTRTRELDATEDSEAIEALYRVLLQRAENRRAGIGKPGGGAPRPGESGKRRKDLRLGELGPGEAGKPIILEPTKGTLSEHDEGNRTPSASTTNII